MVRHLAATGDARRHAGWACYHSELWVTKLADREVGIGPCAVGGPCAVLVADQLAESGCRLLVSITSAGVITPLAAPPYFVIIERAWRDDGPSNHYLPPSDWAHLASDLSTTLRDAFGTPG